MIVYIGFVTLDLRSYNYIWICQIIFSGLWISCGWLRFHWLVHNRIFLIYLILTALKLPCSSRSWFCWFDLALTVSIWHTLDFWFVNYSTPCSSLHWHFLWPVYFLWSYCWNWSLLWTSTLHFLCCDWTWTCSLLFVCSSLHCCISLDWSVALFITTWFVHIEIHLWIHVLVH